MKKLSVFLFLAALTMTGFSGGAAHASEATTVGIWYSTWYAKVPAINTTWITGLGNSDTRPFVGDVDGDGKDDAVAFDNSTGDWTVAISNGNGFNSSSAWLTSFGAGSDNQFLTDVNGDGKKDAAVYFASTGSWYVALSDGSSFQSPSLEISGHGIGSDNQFLADVNGDGKVDAVVYFAGAGDWYVVLANSTGFNSYYSQWDTGHGIGSDNQFLADVNGDGKADAIVFFASTGNWYAANSDGSSFLGYYTWTTGHGYGSQSQLVTDGNGNGFAVPFVFFNGDVDSDGKSGDWYQRFYNKKTQALSTDSIIVNSGFGTGATKVLQGNVTGDPYGWKASVAFYSSTGTWQVEPFHYDKPNLYDTWSAWDIKYEPLTLGSYQQYDSGNAAVVDEHLSQIAAADIDFLLLDETNNLYGDEEYVFHRAETTASRISNWNSIVGHRNLKYALSVGAIHFSHDPQDIEFEAGETWDQFVNTSNGGTENYEYLDGKPLLVIYCTTADKAAWQSWGGDKTNSSRFTIRWANSDAAAGDYGWELPPGGTMDDDEVMLVMPGWNNNVGWTPVSRANGDFYSLFGWQRVLQKDPKPQIVMINSFNEYREETAVAAADTSNVVAPTEMWVDKGGTMDDDMYWNMTTNYIHLLRDSSYQASGLFSKGQGWYGWKYLQWDGSSYSDMTWDESSGTWQGSQAYAVIGSDWQHPDANDSVRAWVAPYSGTVSIQGTPKKQTAAGDGVVVQILKNNTVLWGPQTVTTTSGVSHDFTATVSAGDTLYFDVNENGDYLYDTTLWDPIIAYQ